MRVMPFEMMSAASLTAFVVRTAMMEVLLHSLNLLVTASS